MKRLFPAVSLPAVFLPGVLLPAMLLAPTIGAQQDPDPWEITGANRFSDWQILGPFSAGSAADWRHGFIDTKVLDFAAAVDDEDGGTVRWSATLPDGTALRPGRIVSFNSLGRPNHGIAYVACTITTIADHTATLGLGMDDSAEVWINGEPAFHHNGRHGVNLDQYKFPAELRKGENRILIKVYNYSGDWGVSLSCLGPETDYNRWGKIDDGTDTAPYRVSTVPAPDAMRLEVGGLLFAPDRSLLVCTRRGEVWRFGNPGADRAEDLQASLFATGLHELLGMYLEKDGALLVCQKPEVARLRDTDRDGRADSFETVVDDWGMSGNYHEYAFGLVKDGEGYLWGTLNIGFPSGKGDQLRYRGSAFRISPAGEFLITCYGLRSPNGLMANDRGHVFYTDNQGEWMDVCRLSWLRPKKFYGHPVAKPWAAAMVDFGWETEPTPPAIWFPYHLNRSTSWPVVDRTEGKFGAYAGQVFVGDQCNALISRVSLEFIDGVYQGACYPFWSGFAGGVNRLVFDSDGVLYVGLTDRGWGSVGDKSQGLQRLTFSGEVPFDLQEVRVTRAGFDLEFTEPLAPGVDVQPKRFWVREYGYRYWSTYGSPEVDEREVEVVGTQLSDDRKTVHLQTGERKMGRVFQIQLRGQFVDGRGREPIAREAFYSLHVLPR